MKKIILTVLLSLACYSALAGSPTPTLEFTPPTTRENGAPISQSEIKHYEVYATHTDGTLTKFIIPGSHSVITLPKAGAYTLTAVTVDTDGRVSKPSNSITYVVDQSAPGCPTDLKIVLPAVDPTGAGRIVMALEITTAVAAATYNTDGTVATLTKNGNVFTASYDSGRLSGVA